MSYDERRIAGHEEGVLPAPAETLGRALRVMEIAEIFPLGYTRNC